MPIVTATINKGDLKRAERLLAGIKNGAPKAASRAINKVAKSTRTQVVRQISKETGLPQKDIRQRNVRLRSASYRSLIARLRLFAKAIPIVRLKARQVKSGVTYRLGSVRHQIEHAFIATMPSGHRGVYLRAGKSRLPIRQQYGPNPLDSINPDKLEAKAATDINTELDRQIRVILERGR